MFPNGENDRNIQFHGIRVTSENRKDGPSIVRKGQPTFENSTPNSSDHCINESPYKLLRPLTITLTLFGLLHFHSKEIRWAALATRIYSTVVLLLLWAFVIRFFTLYADEQNAQTLFHKISAHIWSVWGASAATTAYFACRKQGKIKEYLTTLSILMKTNRDRSYIDCARRTELRLYAFLIFSWTLFITACISVAYAILATNFGEFLISPLPINHRYAFVLKSFLFVNMIFLLAGWIFTLCLYYTMVGMMYREFDILNQDFQKAVGDDGDIVGLGKYRRRHQEVCMLVQKADDILSRFNAVSLFMCTLSGLLSLYNLISFPENCTNNIVLASNLFWLTSCLVHMIVVAVGGGYLNHIAHSPLSTIHNVCFNETSAESSIQMTMFLSKLMGEPIGLTAMGMFVIDKPTILTIAGVFLTYFVVLLQFKQPETPGDFPANCTNLTNI